MARSRGPAQSLARAPLHPPHWDRDSLELARDLAPCSRSTSRDVHGAFRQARFQVVLWVEDCAQQTAAFRRRASALGIAALVTGYPDEPAIAHARRLDAIVIPKPWSLSGMQALLEMAAAAAQPDAARMEAAIDRVAAEYGLTAAEKEFLRAFAIQPDLGSVAKRLGVKRSTAKTHAERVRAKMGLRRTAGVLQVLMRFVSGED